MLVLSRNDRDRNQIYIDDVHGNRIVITVVEIRPGKVRLGIDAPKEWPVHRREISEAIERDEQRKDIAESIAESRLLAEGPHESSYRQGYIDAMRNYAVWNDGVQYVGVMRRPLQEAIDEFNKQAIPVRY